METVCPLAVSWEAIELQIFENMALRLPIQGSRYANVKTRDLLRGAGWEVTNTGLVPEAGLEPARF